MMRMTPPPLLLGAALLFWGWRFDLLWLGALCGALLELPHAIKGRWDFSDKEFNRLWDVCTIIFMALGVYLRFSEELTVAAYKFFQWMPIVFYLMALGYVFSTRDTVPLKAFSWFLRRSKSERGERGVGFGWLYFMVCLVAAGATNERDLGFFFGLVALFGWALWSIRPGRVADWAWGALFAIIVGLSYLGQASAQDVQGYFETKASEILVRFGKRDFDPNQSRTAMGRIGKLKQSSRIVMKVFAEAGKMPERLREATFSRFEGATWRGLNRNGFEPLPIEADATTWTLLTNGYVTMAVRTIQRADRKQELLALPPGTCQLRDLNSAEVRVNRLSAVRADGNPGLLNFVARATGEVTNTPPAPLVSGDLRDPRPGNFDYEIPEEEKRALGAVAAQLDIKRLPDRLKIAAIIRFFEANYRYTTYQEARARDLHRETPLGEFLIQTRAGHCEHFATATVMLLRYFDIPARYAVGYAVHEKDRDSEGYVVRERDGHAWALAFVDGRWTEVDSTPPDWTKREEDEFPFYQKFKDALGRFTFGFLEWRWLGDWGVFRMIAPWLVAPMVGFLAWRIFGRKMSTRKRPIRETQIWPGADSEFYELERRLAKAGLARQENESAGKWFARLASEAPGLNELIDGIVRLHYRYRFDPIGLEASERKRLREMVKDCSERLRSP